MIPQLIVIGLWMVGLGMEISKHGEEKKGKHNAWSNLFAIVVWFIILAYGGFWRGIL